MDAFINLLKPPGMTSHDAVYFVRRMLSESGRQRPRVGHGGTLDPGAAGVLVIATGFATRLLEFMDDRKAYRAELRLGITTDTDDAQGNVLAVRSAEDVAQSQLLEALARFTGELDQRPPAYSAIQIDGRRAYNLVRQGRTLELRPRRVTMHSIQLLHYHTGPQAVAMVDVECSGGTYIRSLARDVGEFLGCGAHLAFLVRTRSSNFLLENSTTLEEFRAAVRRDALPALVVPLREGLSDIPFIGLDASLCSRLLRGQAIVLEAGGFHGQPSGLVYVENADRLPVALTRITAEGERFRLQPLKVAEAAA